MAVAGLAVTLVCVWLLRPHGKAHDLNIAAVHLHLTADAAVGLLAIFGLASGRALGWAWADPAAGLVGALFRLSLAWADRLRDALVGWAHDWSVPGFLLVTAACAAATGAAAWLVRRFSPHASGSGIPHVEAVLNETVC